MFVFSAGEGFSQVATHVSACMCQIFSDLLNLVGFLIGFEHAFNLSSAHFFSRHYPDNLCLSIILIKFKKWRGDNRVDVHGFVSYYILCFIFPEKKTNSVWLNVRMLAVFFMQVSVVITNHSIYRAFVSKHHATRTCVMKRLMSSFVWVWLFFRSLHGNAQL